MDNAELLSKLVAGWNADDPVMDAPHVITGTCEDGVIRHVLVLWDAWKGIDPPVRIEIITQAFKQVNGENSVSELKTVVGKERTKE